MQFKSGNAEIPPKALFYEIGTGCDLIVPLSCYFLGVGSQTITDVKPLLRQDALQASLSQFKEHSDRGMLPASFEVKPESCDFQQAPAGGRGATTPHLIESLKKRYGISYVAPFDPKKTGFDSDSVDCISSTHTFEHIPPRDLPLISSECRRILKKGGVVSLRIDHQDHYAWFDEKTGVYNFLKYSGAAWKIFNSPIHYQNRLREKDYVEAFHSAGFKIVEMESAPVTQGDIDKLKELKISKEFTRRYALEALAVRYTNFVLKK